MAVNNVQLVELYRPIIRIQLQDVLTKQSSHDLDAPVTEKECPELITDITNIRSQPDVDLPNTVHWPAVETVCREVFVELVATVDIFHASFSQVWILLDMIAILSDSELCDPSLNFWLIEELLDSQAISGCRKVFDYLESRRERITANHFKHKSLVILRCCNELLRRLSRAEDTVFCGRVFIFLFQSFPLGDKSSVNLRGEFHVENITAFDPIPQKSDDAIKPMELDIDPRQQPSSEAPTPASTVPETELPQRTGQAALALKPSRQEPKIEQPPDLDALYPKFWSLQAVFSSPTRLFEPLGMQLFKDGIETTLSCFKSVSNSSPPNTTTTEVKRGIKRKRSNMDSANTTASTFNPKYLTNRDLFDLEVHDIAFRRHILVQALIMLDFLLSLTPAAKSKSEGLTNKSVLYAYNLSDEDAKWVNSTRASIASYLQQGNGTEGKFYYRMVDTVLSRDKNWVRWKAENCPIISRPAVDVAAHIEAQQTLTKLCEKLPMPTPPGASELEFLSKNEPLTALKHPNERYKLPTMQEYWKSIQGDELDVDFAATNEEKKEIEERKAGRVWRALRASGRRFVLCEKIKDGANLKALVGEDDKEEANDNLEGENGSGEHASPNTELVDETDGDTKKEVVNGDNKVNEDIDKFEEGDAQHPEAVMETTTSLVPKKDPDHGDTEMAETTVIGEAGTVES